MATRITSFEPSVWCSPITSRLALGTAQFGQPYGIANQAGQVSAAEAAAIIACARENGWDTLDTAITYGHSEQRLGEIGVREWRVVTKLPAVPESCRDVAAWVTTAVRESLARLGISKLHGLLLHRPEQLTQPQGEALYGALLAVKCAGMTDGIGVSIYQPEELDALWPRFALDLVQAPFNVLDRRLQLLRMAAPSADFWGGGAHALGISPRSFADGPGGATREIFALAVTLGPVGRLAPIRTDSGDRSVFGLRLGDSGHRPHRRGRRITGST